jgi:hypothetical protein
MLKSRAPDWAQIARANLSNAIGTRRFTGSLTNVNLN